MVIKIGGHADVDKFQRMDRAASPNKEPTQKCSGFFLLK